MVKSKENTIIPQHLKLSKTQVSSLLKEYHLRNVEQLPKIQLHDRGLKNLKIDVGDVVKIVRKGSFISDVFYYRVVIASD